MKLGARTFKTGLAVALAMIVAQYFGFEGGGVIAGIAAIYSTQPSLGRSYTNLKSRIMANTIGGLVAVFVVMTLGYNIYLLGISVMLLIAILNALKLEDVIGLSIVTLIVIMVGTDDNLMLSAAYRVLETFIGVIIAFLVNTFIAPPRYDERLYHTVDYATTEFLIWIRAGLRKNTEYSIMNNDLKWARTQLKKMDNLYQYLTESGLFNKKNKYQNKKMLVVYRKMIQTTRSAFHVLEVLHDYENVFYQFPVEMRIMIRERLETLMSGHEQIMLKFSGRVPANQVNFFEANKDQRHDLMDVFFQRAQEESDFSKYSSSESYGIIHLMSAILAYEDDLVHFNKLVRSYKATPGNKSKNISNIEDIIH
ncbi:MAG: aromatic acid exporter family protein [Trichococcus flocculiformis]